MKLKSFGCSFVFGSDLSDLPDSSLAINPCGKFSRLTWPALLADKLNLNYDCHARPGSGNLQIADRVLNQCADNDCTLYIIDWTWTDRFDYVQSKDFWQPWGTLRPTSEGSVAQSYYQNLHSEYQNKLTSLIYIKTVIDMLLQKKISFIMTYEDTLLFDKNWHTSPAVEHLQSYILPHMTTFESMTFLNWSRHHGFQESDKWHPLEQAHEAAAEYMLKIFDKQKTSDLTQQVRA
jgi:hypothetical protein